MKENDATLAHGEANGPGGTGPSRKSGKHPVFTIAVVVVVLIGGLLALRSFFATPARLPAPVAIPVSVGLAKTGDIDIYLDALGTVTPVYTVTVTSRVAGELTSVIFTEGQMVKKGDLLATIDARPYEALLLQAQGQLARDQALLKNARLDLVRYQNAFEQHAIPEQQLATQQALVEQDAGVVELDQGSLAAAQVNVDYTNIVSPIDGRVGLRTVDPGNIVPANGANGLATVTQLQPITVIFDIAEDDLPPVTAQISAGRTLSVAAFDRSQQQKLAEGALITVDNQINPATGTVRARATFPNLRNELFPNQFVNARLLVKTLSKVTLVPSAAIQRNVDAAYVYVVQLDGTVKSQDVKVIATEGESAAVTGIVPGMQLVTDGFDKLQGGSKVVVKQVQAATPAEPPTTPPPAHE
jgi:multidrug efflux system membrane fusion protein